MIPPSDSFNGFRPFIDIPIVSTPVSGVITPPGSKSITNRAFVCAALSKGKSVLSGILESEDTHVMVQAWGRLGIEINVDWEKKIAVVYGVQSDELNSKSKSESNERSLLPIPSLSEPIDIANSGTSIRFLTAALAACGGDFLLDGIPRMRQRPIGDLVKTLRALGCNVSCQDSVFPPVNIQSNRLVGGKAKVAGNISSQFLSGLLMAAPVSLEGVQIAVEQELVSRPYVDMTIEVMKSFGVGVHQPQENVFQIDPGLYGPTNYQVEPDASAASYFWAAAAITGGSVTVKGLSESSLQGDVGFVRCLEKMGCKVNAQDDQITVIGGDLVGIDVDMSDISDTVQTLAAVALFATGPTNVTGIEHNRHKETDRIEDLATELRRIGADVQCRQDGMTITPKSLKPVEFQTYNDHRMAMSLALIGLRHPGVRVLDPGCTRKTYPGYFEDLFDLADLPAIN